ncbi:MAG: SDR family NAD(P)-dependent oxidoreductase [Spirochaetaceae bacterium]|nr:MAG: SDR family NAD(P)-dependent oxidoreductase [Spirochaetaceae bacterium]
MIPLNGQHAVVTGAARGIGLATVRRLLREGVAVSLWDRDEAELAAAVHALRAEFPAARMATYCVDVTDAAAVAAAVQEAQQLFGGIDILVNNAGHLAAGNLTDQPVEKWDRTIAVNLNALVYTTHAVLPGMYQRGTGHVVNLSSAAATLGVAGLSVYAATKWAVWGLTESLRHEAINLGARGVRFSSIHPIFLREGMFAGARLRGLGALLVPNVKNHDVIARAIVESSLKRGRRAPMRPRTVRLAVLLRGILPGALFDAVVRALGVPQGMSTWKGRGEG